MKKQDYHTSITVNATAQQAFENINSISKWWSQNLEGKTGQPNDVFTVRFGETFITIKIIASAPYSAISWEVIDCYKHWLKNKKEWMGTTMDWAITTDGDTTKISFTHHGLVPGIECYNGCEKAWNFYINESLFKLLTEKKGIPELI